MALLLASIVAHALLGVLLALAIWSLGLALIRERLDAPHGYPVGLLAAVVVAFAALVRPWLGMAALVVVAVLMLTGARSLRTLSRAWPTLAWAAPGVVGLPIALGLLLHGPTETHDSSAFGDQLFWAAHLLAATVSVSPLRDLLLEGHTLTYVESAGSFLGGALAWVPGLDAILFQTTTLPALMLTSLCVGIPLAVPARGVGVALGVLSVAVIAYPTWLAESPPVALAIPLGLSLYVLAVAPPPMRRGVVLVALLALAFFLTKVVGLAVLAVVVVGALARRRAFTLVRAAAALAAIVIPGLIWLATARDELGWLTELFEPKFLPADAVRGLEAQVDARDTQAAAPAFQMVGELFLAAALVRARAWVPVGALATGIAGTWFVGGHGFDIAVGLGVFLAVLFLATTREEAEGQRMLVAAAAGVLLVSAWFRDISGVRAAFVLVALFAATLLVAVPRARLLAWAAASAALAIALTGALTDRPTTLTPSDHDLWSEVRERAPRDALIFTSMTGPAITGDEGWNYYPGVARRQVYVAGWSSSPLLVDEDARKRRLEANASVLDGDVHPSELDTRWDYSKYYAVLRRYEDAPATFRRLYANVDYALYEIP